MVVHGQEAVITHVKGLCALLATAGACACSTSHAVEAGFWFDPVIYASPRLGGMLTSEDIAAIDSHARAEIARAFSGLRITVSHRRAAHFRVRVVQQLWDARVKRTSAVAGR